jgi:lipopolysaccharide export system permease protein
MKTIDRYLFGSFLASWLICFVSMVGLYVIIDLFANADEFLEDAPATITFVRRVAMYYGVHTFEYYARLAPIITMIAGMITLAALHRHNELVALLAAGIPTRRVIVPVIIGASLMIGFGVVNREVILPAYSDVLQRFHEDIDAKAVLIPSVHSDQDQVLIRAESAYREDQRLENVNVTLPMELVGLLQDVRASRAYFTSDPRDDAKGWRLENSSPVQILKETNKVRRLPDGELFLTSNVTFRDMIRRRNWLNFASTAELIEELNENKTKNPLMVSTIIHNRLMQPALNFVLVLMGIPFVLQWRHRNVFRSIGVSMGLCGLFYLVDATSSYFATYGYLDPVTASWAPVFLFGPAALAFFYRIGT